MRRPKVNKSRGLFRTPGAILLILITLFGEVALCAKDHQSTPHMVKQLHFWESRYNDVNVVEALSKIFTVEPNHPSALAALIRLQIRESKFDLAQKTLLRLTQTKRFNPDEKWQLEELLRIYKEHKVSLNRARLFAKSGRYKESVKLYEKVFVNGLPGRDLSFEYWQVHAQAGSRWDDVLAELSTLSDLYPDNIRYRLGYFSHYLGRFALQDHWFDALQDYAEDRRFGYQAKAIWKQALQKRPLVESTMPYLSAFLRMYPRDGEINALFEKRKQRIVNAKRMRHDHHYQAKLRGIEALEQGDFSTAETELARAYTKYSKDVEIIGAFGMLNMRQGRHAQAKKYFNVALSLDSSNESKWRSLIRTSQFWGRVSNAKQALDQNDLSRAAGIIAKLSAQEPGHVEVLLLSGRLATYQRRYPDAKSFYRRVLALEPLNRLALENLLAIDADRKLASNVMQTLRSYTAEQKILVDGFVVALEIAQRLKNAELWITRGNYSEAIVLLESILSLAPDSPWVRYKLAKLFSLLGVPEAGEMLFIDTLLPIPNMIPIPNAIPIPVSGVFDSAANSAEQVTLRYAYALYLSSINEDQRAIDQLHFIPLKQRSSGAVGLLERLEFDWILARALDESKQKNIAQWMSKALSSSHANPNRLFRVVDAWLTLDNPSKALWVLNTQFDPYKGLANSVQGDVLVKRCEINLQLGQLNPCLVDLSMLDSLSGKDIKFANRYRKPMIEICLAIAEQSAESFLESTLLDKLLSDSNLTANEKAGYWVARADSLFGRDQYSKAFAYYHRALILKPKYPEAIFGQISVKRTLGERDQALALIEPLMNEVNSLTTAQQVELADLLMQDGQLSQATRIIKSVVSEGRPSAVSLLLAGQLAERNQAPQLAQAYYFQGLSAENDASVGSGVPLANRSNNTPSSLETLLRENKFDTWPKNKIKNRLLALREKQLGHVLVAFDLRRRSGTLGQSETNWLTVPVEIQWGLSFEPFNNGVGFIRIDSVSLDSGAVDYGARISDAQQFGAVLLCESQPSSCPVSPIRQRSDGIALGVGYRSDRWEVDIGTRPLGFEVNDWVGGLEYSTSWRDMGLFFDLSKRPVTSTLLSYSGTKDPLTGQSWGGVYAFGVTVGGSYDQGELFGMWVNIDAHRLDGENVLANNRYRVLSGFYWRVLQQEVFNIDLGLGVNGWRFKHDLGEFTFGQGGYYSPNEYTSGSVPVSFYGRVNRLAYLLRIAGSVSRSTDEDSVFYPNNADLQDQAEQLSGQTGVDPVFKGGSGSGTGYSINGRLEYQVIGNLYLGAEFEIERSDFYTPNRGSIWLRYLFKPTFLPIPYPPESVKHYADF